MRINKYLAGKGYSTRVGADELVKKGRVFITGRLAVLGDKVSESDVVEVRGKGKPENFLYFAYHKPRGVETGSPKKDVFPIGRLDKDSSGLLILTNDGRVTDRLLNPDYAHEKEYLVKVKSNLRPSFKTHMEQGVEIEGYVTKPAKVKILNDRAFRIILTEGKKHQIRRMVVALHNEVAELKRERVMNVELGNLAEGSTRKIEGEELETFHKNLNLK